LRTHDIAATKAIVDPNIAILNPIELLKSLPQRRHDGLAFGIFRTERQKGSDMPHPLALLPMCGERPCGCRTAEKRNELASVHAPSKDHVLCNAQSLSLCDRATSEKWRTTGL
jgi:hypothetical protein